MVARELLTESGSIFVQIGDENVHCVRSLMDEVFGRENAVSQIAFRTTTGRAAGTLAGALNYILWYARDSAQVKYRNLFGDKSEGTSTATVYGRVRDSETRATRTLTRDERMDYGSIAERFCLFRPDNLTSSRTAGDGDVRDFLFSGTKVLSWQGNFQDQWNRIEPLEEGRSTLADKRRHIAVHSIFQRLQCDSNCECLDGIPVPAHSRKTSCMSFQTGAKVIERCLLMTTCCAARESDHFCTGIDRCG